MTENTPDVWTGEGVVAYIDIDDFKQVNDIHGHDVGDQVIEAVAQLGYDHTPDDGQFIREYDQGDEFLIILPESDKDPVADVVENLRTDVADTEPHGINITISVGIAAAESSNAEFEKIKNQAEEAMRRAKDWGGDQVQEYGNFEPLSILYVRFDIAAPPGRPDDRIIFETWRDDGETDIRAEEVRNETTGAMYESESSTVMTSSEYYEGELRAVVNEIRTVDRRGVVFTVKVRESDYEEIFGD